MNRKKRRALKSKKKGETRHPRYRDKGKVK
jgi:hypothetical protein